MKSKEEIKKWLLENCVDEDGDLDLRGLDFSDFDGDVCIKKMKVKGNLYQNCQEVDGRLCQDCQKVKGYLYQDNQEVARDLNQDNQKVDGDLNQDCQKVKGNLYQDNQKVKGNLNQSEQKVKGNFITQRLKEDEEYKIDKNGYNTIIKKVKTHTLE